ncbi:MAG: TAXI family TRAP transporter solute-binding subunit [Thermodesulfobacteriota bacterium]|nr:TAXI family TRAP transporter solute-binding subunit [Thermodesulfobacteriota bacterium]
MRSKSFSFLTAIVFIVSIIVIAPGNAGAVKFLSFGTGSPAGTYYFLGAGFAAIINKNVPGVRVTAESTAASTENARYMVRGKMDMGLASMGTVNGLKKQGMDVDKLRLVAVGHTSDTHWIVRKNSPIKSCYDFKGKVIGVGPAGSATLNIWSKKHLAAGWGITFDDIKPKYISFHEITRGIRDNTIDAGLIAAGYPIAAVMELARDIPIRILDVNPEVIEKLQAKYPNVTPFVFPSGTYKGIDKDVHTYVLPQMWLCRTDLPEDLVYKILKAVYDNSEDRNAIHPMAKKYTIENAFRGSKSVPVGYHPGAIKYYKEKGIWDKRAQYQ